MKYIILAGFYLTIFVGGFFTGLYIIFTYPDVIIWAIALGGVGVLVGLGVYLWRFANETK